MEKTDALSVFSALAHETRLSVFQLLVAMGPEGIPAGEIAERLDVKPNTLSNHLNILTNAKLVRPGRDGRVIRYSANYASMQGFMQFMIKDCCHGREELCSPLLTVLTDCETCVATGENAQNLLRS